MTLDEIALEDSIETAARWIVEARHVVVFTGAGLSTASGLPDYRGPDGVWTRRDKGLPPPAPRGPWTDIKPNEGHFAIVDLEKMGKVQFLISQNVDGLHRASGFPQGKLAELHGNHNLMRCNVHENRDRLERSDTRDRVSHVARATKPAAMPGLRWTRHIIGRQFRGSITAARPRGSNHALENALRLVHRARVLARCHPRRENAVACQAPWCTLDHQQQGRDSI